MSTLTVRNVPEDAKHRFRQVAAAHGRSMEEHLRQLIIEAGRSVASDIRLKDDRPAFRHEKTGEEIVRELIKAADGAGSEVLDPRKYAEIRFMTAKDAMAELRRLANGVGFDAPRDMSTDLEAPGF